MLHQTTFTHNTLYTKHLLHQTPFQIDTFTPETCYTKQLLHITPCTPNNFCTRNCKNQTTFTPNTFYIRHLLHQTHFNTKQVLHQPLFTPDTTSYLSSCAPQPGKSKSRVPFFPKTGNSTLKYFVASGSF